MNANKLESYRITGEQAAQAMNRQDMANYHHWRKQFQAMRYLESTEDRAIADAEFDDAYKSSRRI